MRDKGILQVALVQMNSSPDIETNFLHAIKAIDRVVKDLSADLIVFPENFLYFGDKPTSALCKDINSKIDLFKSKARSVNSNLLLGTVPVPVAGGCKNNKFYSCSYLLGKNGEVLACYNKRHLFDVEVEDGYGSYRESDTYLQGKDLVAVELEWGSANIGLSICFDLRFPEHFQELVRMGANIMVAPSAFTSVTGRAHWEVLLRARAIETQSFVLACNQVGNHTKERKTYGHSMVIDPWGRVIAEVGDSVGICHAEIDLKQVEEIRQKMPLSSARLLK